MVVEKIFGIFKPDRMKVTFAALWFFSLILFVFISLSFHFRSQLAELVIITVFFPLFLTMVLDPSSFGIAIIIGALAFYLPSCIFVELYRFRKKGGAPEDIQLISLQGLKEIFGFNKLRLILFLLIFLLVPVSLVYNVPRSCAIGCGLEPRFCAMMIDFRWTPLIHGAFLVIDDYLRCFSGNLMDFLKWEMPKNLVIAFFGSYLLMKFLRKKLYWSKRVAVLRLAK